MNINDECNAGIFVLLMLESSCINQNLMEMIIMTNRRKHRICALLAIVLFAVLAPVLQVSGQDGSPKVTVVVIDGEITPAMASFLGNAIDAANRDGADGILIEISTLGGQVASAIEMRDAIIASDIPVAVYIGDRAISAGALISIAADTIIMAPGSHIGAAEPIPNDAKSVAYVSGEFRTTAEKTGRDPELAAAMADAAIEIEGIVDAGEILDLTAQEANDLGFADYIAGSRSEALQLLGWQNASVTEVEPDFKYRIAHFLTSYEVAAILLLIGMIGLIAELFIPGFGAAGILGIICFALYFAGGFLAGHTEWWSILIFVAGIILISIEIIVPGFGFFGIAGIIALFVGIVFAAPTAGQGIGVLLIAIVAALIAIPIFFKIFGRTKFMRRLVLNNAETGDQGFTSVETKSDLLGKTGVALTVLRPAGSVSLDGIRVDAVADGEFINPGTQVKVIRMVGSSVVVTTLQ